MKRRITIHDLSKALGVSSTTVYKALNGKPKISDETRKLVLETAAKMGFKANTAAKSLARKPIKIGVVVDSSIPDFHDEIIRGAGAACEELVDFNVHGDYRSVSGTDRSKRMLNAMDELVRSGCSGIVISPGVDTRGYAEKIAELASANIPCATVVTDVCDSIRAFCVRYDGRRGGRIAAQLLSWLADVNEVALFTGNRQVLIHRETAGGFEEEAKKRGLRILGVYENQDDADIAYYAAGKLVSDFPGIGGIYVNSANSVPVCRKITELGLASKIKIVASDVFPDLAVYLKAGTIHASIVQDPFKQGKIAFRRLYGHISGDGGSSGGDTLISPRILLESNLDEFIQGDL